MKYGESVIENQDGFNNLVGSLEAYSVKFDRLHMELSE
jgi:hypothetical protein